MLFSRPILKKPQPSGLTIDRLSPRAANFNHRNSEQTRSIMGMVFGKIGVDEPHFDVLLSRTHPSATVAYEIRKYGERFAAEASYPPGSTENGTPFTVLGKYIGVFGTPENEGSEKISMTAPVVIGGGGTEIAMTAPVVLTEGNDGTKTMQFMLPASYDQLSKIPKPTNPAVHILEIPPAVGAVYRFNGSFAQDRAKLMAVGLGKQLEKDGINMPDALEKFQFWGYNPPFTIPYFRRNEVWIPLTQEQADYLVKVFELTTTY